MKKRLQLKKVTLKDLDGDAASHVAGGGTYGCANGTADTCSCENTNCESCAGTCAQSNCGTCGYPCNTIGCQSGNCGTQFYTCNACDATATCGCFSYPGDTCLAGTCGC